MERREWTFVLGARGLCLCFLLFLTRFFMLWDALSLLLDLSAGRRPVGLSLPPTANGGLPLDTSPLYLSKS
jgi:hypothetical protein